MPKLRDTVVSGGRRITRWYDRQSRNWIVQLLDPSGNQIGDAVIVGRMQDAQAVTLADFNAQRRPTDDDNEARYGNRTGGRRIRLTNPVPPSSVLQAERLYRAFTGDEPTQELIIEAPEIPALAVAIGTVDAIAYTTVRDGKVEHYQHEFAQHARPIFAVSPDGRQLLVLHGNYTFTERGIVDGRKPRK